MAVIASLNILMKSDTGALEKGIDKAVAKTRDLKQAADTATTAGGGAFARLKNAVASVGSAITSVFTSMGGIVSGAFTSVSGVVTGVFSGIRDVASTSFSAVTSIASGVFSGLKGIVTGAMSGISGIVGGIFGALKTAATNVFAQFGNIAQMGRFAKSIGISTEALGGLRYAASQSGIEAQQLDLTLQAMSKNLALAGHGAGDSIVALRALQLNAVAMNNLSPDQQLEKLADALSKVANEGDKVALATKLFGDQGPKMLGMLSGGAKGLQDFKKEAQALGLTLNESQVKQAAEAEKAMAKMNAAIQSAWQKIAIAIAPFVGSMADGIANLVASLARGLENMSFNIKNFRLIWSLAIDRMYLRLVGFANDLKHIFLEVIPTVFTVFGRVMGKTFTNIGANITAAAKGAWDVFKTRGKKIEFNWKPLGEGIDDEMKKLDGIMKRPMTDWEINKRKDIADQQAELNQKFKEMMDKRNEKIDPKERAKSALGAAAFGQAPDRPGAANRDSVEAFKIISGVQRDKMFEVANKQLQEARNNNKKFDDLLKRIKDNPGLVAAFL